MSSARQRICILGSTGSIGENTLRVAGDYPQDFEIVGLSANGSAGRLAEQARAFNVPNVCLVSDIPFEAPSCARRQLRGEAGLVELVEACEPDLIVVATVGYAGLAPTLRAIELGVTVGLANKEVLVTAGELVMAAARRREVAILPIDSEHNAIFQCLAGRAGTPLRRIILTASGGPFRGCTREQLAQVTPAQALAHPTWNMGAKITIDSSTLMNKGFEVIEACHLFGEPAEKVEVVVHPQSVIHSMIEYHDGSMLAQLGVTDMYLPIANVLAYPRRLENTRFEPLNLASVGALTFQEPDLAAFPCLQYAYDCIRAGQTFPTVLNAANEVAVARFLEGRIRYLDIPGLIDAALQAHQGVEHPQLEDIARVDAQTRGWCETACERLVRAGV